MMNMLKFYKQALAILLVSFLFVGCSNKSSSTTDDATSNPTTQDGNGTAQDGNGTNQDANTTTVVDDADDAEDQVILDGNQTIKKEIITNCRDEITIKIRDYDENGNLVKITEYRDVTDKNVDLQSLAPYSTRTYNYDGNGTIVSRTTIIENGEPETVDLFKPLYNDDRDASGTGTIVSVDALGTIRTFTYENGTLVSGKAEYKDGTITYHAYDLDAEDRITKVTVTDDSGHIIETRTFTYDAEGNRTDGKDKVEDECPVTTEYEYL